MRFGQQRGCYGAGFVDVGAEHVREPVPRIPVSGRSGQREQQPGPERRRDVVPVPDRAVERRGIAGNRMRDIDGHACHCA